MFTQLVIIINPIFFYFFKLLFSSGHIFKSMTGFSFSFFFFFNECTCGIWKLLVRNWSPATSVTSTAHGNVRSLTHWARPGIELATSWFLVSFVSAVPWWELQDVVWIYCCQIINMLYNGYLTNYLITGKMNFCWVV